MMRLRFYLCVFFSAISLVNCTHTTKKEEFYCGVVDSPPTHRDSMPEIMKAKCATCHIYDARTTGPKLQGTPRRMPAGNWFSAFIRAEDSLAAQNDPYVIQLKKEYPYKFNHRFQELTNKDIAVILEYMR